MHTIVKQLSFCYGHRIMNHDGKCAHIHGHNGSVEIEISEEKLNELGMVCDFSQVKNIAKTFIDSELDHKILLRKDDPLVNVLQEY